MVRKNSVVVTAAAMTSLMGSAMNISGINPFIDAHFPIIEGNTYRYRQLQVGSLIPSKSVRAL